MSAFRGFATAGRKASSRALDEILDETPTGFVRKRGDLPVRNELGCRNLRPSSGAWLYSLLTGLGPIRLSPCLQIARRLSLRSCSPSLRLHGFCRSPHRGSTPMPMSSAGGGCSAIVARGGFAAQSSSGRRPRVPSSRPSPHEPTLVAAVTLEPSAGRCFPSGPASLPATEPMPTTHPSVRDYVQAWVELRWRDLDLRAGRYRCPIVTSRSVSTIPLAALDRAALIPLMAAEARATGDARSRAV